MSNISYTYNSCTNNTSYHLIVQIILVVQVIHVLHIPVVLEIWVIHDWHVLLRVTL